MKQLLIALVLCIPLVGCEGQSIFTQPAQPVVSEERPTVNIPKVLRQKNWIGNRREGSCVHATMISLMRWQGRYNLANKWRRTYGNGAWPSDLAQKLEQKNVRYAYTEEGDVKFLEWACRTRRGCGITVMGGAHMVALVHLDNEWACLLDNNNISKYKWVPRGQLIAEWRASYGWAATILYSPTPPLPMH